MLGDRLRTPNLWHLNRFSVSRGIAVGLFVAMLPLPFQVIIAAWMAMIVQGHLAMSLLLVWLNNPFTWAFILFLDLKTGLWITGKEMAGIPFSINLAQFPETLAAYTGLLLLGGVTNGCIAAAIGYALTMLVWRLSVTRAWLKRKQSQSSREH